ncbi:hypothetical protein G3I76_26925 [Streptomyces sp. SID11233]|nr:hypothetical protein [Streptomyces sp. SID11233]
MTDAPADRDHGVAYLAQSLLSDPARLRGYLGQAPMTDAALWAAYALHRLTGDADGTRAVYEALGRPRVEVDGLDEELRGAIVHEYADRCERRSDPRWRVEALCTDPPVRPDEEGQLHRVMAALTAAGPVPEPPVPCGEHNHQGGGTYHVIGWGESEVWVSTLGRFVTGAATDVAARNALASAGFRWIDETTGAIRVTGLCVYCFGEREPVSVDTLLFYWQD